jgi:carbonic anhydrase
LGHEHCGAVKSAIDGVELGNITEMLSKIEPAVKRVEGYEDDRSSKNEAFVHEVTEQNVKLNIQRIRDESPILRQMESDGEIAIVGGLYDIDNGKVTFLA